MTKEGDWLNSWGGKGEVHNPSKCQHEPDDGCEWCCSVCNYDRHLCPGCGTVSNHKCEPCDEKCAELAKLPYVEWHEHMHELRGEAT